MTKKQQLIKLNNEFDSNLLIKDIKKYNNVKSYIDEDADNPKVKYYLFVVNEDNKISLCTMMINPETLEREVNIYNKRMGD